MQQQLNYLLLFNFYRNIISSLLCSLFFLFNYFNNTHKISIIQKLHYRLGTYTLYYLYLSFIKMFITKYMTLKIQI